MLSLLLAIFWNQCIRSNSMPFRRNWVKYMTPLRPVHRLTNLVFFIYFNSPIFSVLLTFSHKCFHHRVACGVSKWPWIVLYIFDILVFLSSFDPPESKSSCFHFSDRSFGGHFEFQKIKNKHMIMLQSCCMIYQIKVCSIRNKKVKKTICIWCLVSEICRRSRELFKNLVMGCKFCKCDIDEGL